MLDQIALRDSINRPGSGGENLVVPGGKADSWDGRGQDGSGPRAKDGAAPKKGGFDCFERNRCQGDPNCPSSPQVCHEGQSASLQGSAMLLHFYRASVRRL